MWAVTAWIGVQGIELTNSRAGAGIGRRRDLNYAVVPASDAVGGKRGTGDVAGEALELLGILRGERISGEDGKSGMYPGKKSFHETL